MTERYQLTRHEDGGWNVIDSVTGGPVEINGLLLSRLDSEDAEDLLHALNHDIDSLTAKLEEILHRQQQKVT